MLQKLVDVQAELKALRASTEQGLAGLTGKVDGMAQTLIERAPRCSQPAKVATLARPSPATAAGLNGSKRSSMPRLYAERLEEERLPCGRLISGVISR